MDKLNNVIYIFNKNDLELIKVNQEIQKKYELLTPRLIKNTFLDKLDDTKQNVVFDLYSLLGLPLSLVLFFDDEAIYCLVAENETEYAVNKEIIFSSSLREPLTGIFSLFPVIIDNINSNKNQKAIDNLQAMYKQTYIALRNVSNISLVNRILAKEEFKIDNIDFSQLLNSILKTLPAIIPNLKLNIEIEDNIYIKANKQLLTNGILMLISNSIKFKKDEMIIIDITLKENNKNCILKYKDNSIGIKDELIEKVFLPYYSKDPYNDGEMSFDMGMGLFILKTAVDVAKGNILLTSEFSKGVLYNITFKTNDEDLFIQSKPTDYLLNRYSEVFIQLSENCILPDMT